MFRCKQFAIDDSLCAMKVSTDALILGSWAQVNDARRILDIGCGSGILSLMMLQKSHPECVIEAIDIDVAAVEQTLVNFNSCEWGHRARVACSTLKDWQQSPYDVIISNPPYFQQEESWANAKMDDKRRKARFQSSLTMSALFAEAKTLSHDTTKVYLMYPYGLKAEVIKTAEQHGLFPERVQDVKSTPETDPYLSLFLFTPHLIKNARVLADLVIRDKADYSQSFKALCKDFYLRF